jgi:hypothetical protein
MVILLAKYSSNMLLIIMGLAVIISGCLGGQDTAPAVKVPAANIKAENFSDSPEADLAIIHNGGDHLYGGDWKLSIVPAGSPPKFITSAPGEDLSAGKGVIAIGTTESTPIFLEGKLFKEVLFIPLVGEFFTSGAEYDVKLVYIPSNSMLIDTIVKVSGKQLTPEDLGAGKAPVLSIIVANYPDTPALDLWIAHKDGYTLKGGEWKLSIVPEGSPPKFITSSHGSDFSAGDKILATTTTEGATGLTDTALEGGGALASGVRYHVMLLDIPVNALLVDTTVTVK